QVLGLDHAVADAVLYAPGQQWAQRVHTGLQQVELADRLRAALEHRLHRIQSVQPHFLAARRARRSGLGEYRRPGRGMPRPVAGLGALALSALARSTLGAACVTITRRPLARRPRAAVPRT